MADKFDHSPELFDLLVDAIGRLSKAKKGAVLFFRGAAVPEQDLAEVDRIVQTDRDSISKFEIVRNVLEKVNTRGDSGLQARREIIKRVVEFEDFEVSCWENGRLIAKGLIAKIRKIVNVKDSFTRMKQERDKEREAVQAKACQERESAAQRKAQIDGVSKRLAALFAMNDKPQERGKLLEAVLNDLFKAYGIHVRGVIELDGSIHLVETKWLKDTVGVAEFGSHLVRVFGRANTSGIFISNSKFTEPVIKQCTEFLNKNTIFLCTLEEIVMLLQRQDDLVALFKRKSQAAIVDKNPFLEILV